MTYTFTPALIGNDSFTGALSRTAGEDVGTYAINQNTLALSSNYTLAYTGALLTIAPATNMATLADAAFTYDGTAKSLAVNNAAPGATVTYTGNGQVNAGVYNVVATVKQTGFTDQTLTATLTINKAPLTITADDKAKLFGADNPVLTAHYTGFAGNDTQANLTAQPLISTTAATNSAAGSYPITVSGAASNNYNISYVNGTLTIIASSISTLNNLTISTGTLSPVFASSTTAYTTSVSYDTQYVTLTASFDPTSGATIGGTAIPNGNPSFPVKLQDGTTTIAVVVAAQDGVTKNSYTVSVYRATAPADISPTNILTPNGDGKNDVWMIKDIELYPKNKVMVFDKAGRPVYQKIGYQNDWGGTVNNAPLDQGTYYYVVELAPGIKPIKGFITILRNSIN